MFSHLISKSDKSKWRIFYALILVGAALWCATILLTPLLSESRPLEAKWIRFFFNRICHQDPLRSFSCEGYAFPVCARCTGIYAGFLGGTLFYPSLQRWVGNDFRWRLWIGLAVAVNLLEWGVTYFHLFSGLWPRAISGVFLGSIIALCTLSGLHELFTRKGRVAS